MAQPYPTDETHDTHETDDAARLPAVKIDQCAMTFRCDMPHCAGRGSTFATDMSSGALLGHYCAAHSAAEIRLAWRELAMRDSDPIVAWWREGGAE